MQDIQIQRRTRIVEGKRDSGYGTTKLHGGRHALADRECIDSDGRGSDSRYSFWFAILRPFAGIFVAIGGPAGVDARGTCDIVIFRSPTPHFYFVV